MVESFEEIDQIKYIVGNITTNANRILKRIPTFRSQMKSFFFVICEDCGHDEFFCHDNKTCVDAIYLCDGDIDCPGGEDEDNCGG